MATGQTYQSVVNDLAKHTEKSYHDTITRLGMNKAKADAMAGGFADGFKTAIQQLIRMEVITVTNDIAEKSSFNMGLTKEEASR